MRINVLPVASYLHKGRTFAKDSKKLLTAIEAVSDYTFELSDTKSFYDTKISLILVQSGGSEGGFLEMLKDLKPPFYLLTYGSNNSLAASMEILSYLKDSGEEAEILHGSVEYITNRINELLSDHSNKPTKLGVVGAPSDWLIASNVDYAKVMQKYNIELVDVEISELINLYKEIKLGDYEKDLVLDFDPKEVDDAKRMSKALVSIKEKYGLSGLTLRCFDLLDTCKTTGCLGLALLNSKDSIGTCEGDIPAMLSMYLTKEITGQPGFQANPSSIDIENNEMILAHCTLPLNMVDNFKTMTHFESGIGVAFRGEMKLTDITVFKLSRNLEDYYVANGKIIENLNEDDLCRTQIKIQVEDAKYFLTKPLGNHHIIIYGDHKQEIIDYMRNLK